MIASGMEETASREELIELCKFYRKKSIEAHTERNKLLVANHSLRSKYNDLKNAADKVIADLSRIEAEQVVIYHDREAKSALAENAKVLGEK